MSDLTDDPTLLASVYLDNEATRDERALVETSQEALAEVERLSRVRTVLAATIEPVSLAEREGHLAAALDVWERMTVVDGTGEVAPAGGVDAAAAAALTTPRSSSTNGQARRGSERSGWSSSPWLLGAAATLVVVAGVGAVLRGGVGSSNDDASSSPPAESSSGDLEAGSGAHATETPPVLADSQAAPADDPEAVQSDAESATANTESTEAPAGELNVVPDPAVENDLVLLETTDDLASFAGAVPLEERQGDLASRFEDGSCQDTLSIELIVDVAYYQDTFVTVGIDLPESIAVAYTADCAIVAQAPLAN